MIFGVPFWFYACAELLKLKSSLVPKESVKVFKSQSPTWINVTITGQPLITSFRPVILILSVLYATALYMFYGCFSTCTCLCELSFWNGTLVRGSWNCDAAQSLPVHGMKSHNHQWWSFFVSYLIIALICGPLPQASVSVHGKVEEYQKQAELRRGEEEVHNGNLAHVSLVLSRRASVHKLEGQQIFDSPQFLLLSSLSLFVLWKW